MHIVDGVLSTEVLLTGAALTGLGLMQGMRHMPLEKIPATGILAAMLFIASLVHVPMGPVSVHLIMNGVAGILLGWAVMPALFVGLLLQAVLFGYGGVTVLGVNAFNIALPALLVYFLIRPFLAAASDHKRFILGAIGGGLAVAGTTIMVATSLWLSGDEFIPAAQLVLVSHIPVICIEAVLSGATLYLIGKVRPELFIEKVWQ
ncbi:MAG TPA: cobalt transporter CbiM [Oceanospirillaceae bacterium]|nr:cobalt transporter CbiM [Oceanospirillaceae bacterium]